MTPALILRTARTLARRSKLEKVWFLPVFVLLGLARLALLIAPFRRIAPHLGVMNPDGPAIPLATRAQMSRAYRLGRLIEATAAITPWQSKCLAQAMVAALALRVHRIPYLLCLGVAKDEAKGLKAHAWVATDRVAVTGGRSFLGFAVVGAFEYGGNE